MPNQVLTCPICSPLFTNRNMPQNFQYCTYTLKQHKQQSIQAKPPYRYQSHLSRHVHKTKLHSTHCTWHFYQLLAYYLLNHNGTFYFTLLILPINHHKII